MRRSLAALLLFAGQPCSAAITDVHVTGVTATQAIVAYTAPDSNACTVQVSENESLEPLVHDVDPAVFGDAEAGGGIRIRQ